MPEAKFHIVDSVMGSGKTTAAIAYINAHPEWRFIFVTPYLNEVKRIKTACASMDFIEPEEIPKVKTKTMSLKELVKKNKNIVTTHVLFFMQGYEIAELFKKFEYHLIIDEAPSDVIRPIQQTIPLLKDDIEMMINRKIISINKDFSVDWIFSYKKETIYDNIKSLCRGKRLRGYYVINDDDDIECGLVEMFPAEMFQAFTEVILLTYLFDGQMFSPYLKMTEISYDNWYVFDGAFTSDESLKDFFNFDYRPLIHILGGDEDKDSKEYKMNAVGDGTTALSHSWYVKHPEGVEYLRMHLINFLKNITKSKKGERMWTTFISHMKEVSGRRYNQSFVPCNTRATNDYRECTKLAYLVNRFISPDYSCFLKQFGIVFDNDLFALSEMLQWIWRSAIRDGKEIEIYVPSERMRKLLKDWMERVAGDETGDAEK